MSHEKHEREAGHGRSAFATTFGGCLGMFAALVVILAALVLLATARKGDEDRDRRRSDVPAGLVAPPAATVRP